MRTVLLFAILALCLAVAVTAKPHYQHRDITLESTAPKANLKNVTVIAAPVHHGRHHRKMHGNFSHRPLLDNGKEFLKAEIPRKYRRDPCTGCVVPVKVHPKLDPRNRLDRKGNVIGKKKLLPVEPELRERYSRRAERRAERRAARKAARQSHERPEFYPLDHKTRKALKKEHEHPHKIVKRLPNIPEFYPAKKPKRIYNPPEGWPKLHEKHCDKDC